MSRKSMWIAAALVVAGGVAVLVERLIVTDKEAILLAAERAGKSEDAVLAKELQDKAVEHVAAVRTLRGVPAEAAEATGLALCSFPDHVTALYQDQLRAFGLSVTVAEDARWSRLITCYSWSRL